MLPMLLLMLLDGTFACENCTKARSGPMLLVDQGAVLLRPRLGGRYCSSMAAATLL